MSIRRSASRAAASSSPYDRPVFPRPRHTPGMHGRRGQIAGRATRTCGDCRCRDSHTPDRPRSTSRVGPSRRDRRRARAWSRPMTYCSRFHAPPGGERRDRDDCGEDHFHSCPPHRASFPARGGRTRRSSPPPQELLAAATQSANRRAGNCQATACAGDPVKRFVQLTCGQRRSNSESFLGSRSAGARVPPGTRRPSPGRRPCSGRISGGRGRAARTRSPPSPNR